MQALMYWLNASRFFTYSQSLLSDENRPKPFVSKGLYEFAGVCGLGYWTYNGDTLICIEPSGPPPMAAAGGDVAINLYLFLLETLQYLTEPQIKVTQYNE